MVERNVKLMSVQASPSVKKIDQCLADRARLRPEEGVDPAGARADLPERDDADQDADLRRDDRPGRPVLLHRQAARGLGAVSAARLVRDSRLAMTRRRAVVSWTAMSGGLLKRGRADAAAFRQRSLMAMNSGVSALVRTRGRGSVIGMVSRMRPGRVPMTWISSDR